MFRHPKYYKELRKRNKSDQVISANKLDGDMKVRAPGPGLQHVIEETVPHNDIEEASSDKPQATSSQATSSQASSDKLQAPSNKRQASSRKRQAL
jgi:hypothetical protein